MKKILAIVLIVLAFTADAASQSDHLTRVRVVLSRTKQNGKPWDALGGKPDPYVVINDQSYEAYTCFDSYTCNFFTTATGRMLIEVWDLDAIHDDFAGAVECAPGFTCFTGTGTKVIVQ
jgi:hypothetical protein